MLLGTVKRRGGRAALWLLVGLLVGGAAGAGVMYVLKKGKDGIPGGPRLGDADEMVHVPGDAAGFVHVRLRGLWDTEGFSEVRKLVDAAGPQAKKALDESFVPAPSSLDRMTLVFLKAPPKAGGPAGAGGPAAPPEVLPVPKKGPVPRQNARQPKAGFPPPPLGGPPPVPGGFIPPIGDIVPSIGSDLKVVVLLAFNAPFDPEQVRSAHAKNAITKKAGEREYLEDAETDVALYVPNNTTLAIGDPVAIRTLLVKLGPPSAPTPGPLTKAIEHAQKGGRHFVAALNVAQFGIPMKGLDETDDGSKEVAKNVAVVLKAESLMLGVAVTSEGTKVEVRAKYKDDESAAAGETALRGLGKFARTKLEEPKKSMDKAVNGRPDQKKPRPIRDLPEAVGGLLGLGAINALGEWLDDPPLKTEGSEVVLTPRVPSIAAVYAATAASSVALLLPATERVGAAANRMKDSNNLKMIALGMHIYHDSMGRLPPQDGKTGPEAKGGLSWRVHILPFIEQEALYKQFNLDEPWDSEHNKKLIPKMPIVYASPLVSDPAGQTRYKVFSGRDAVVFPGSKIPLVGITDGTSNTILIAGGGAPVTWTKPDDIEFTGPTLPSVLALPGHSGCNVALADGSVRWVDLSRLTPDKLKALITRDGGEVIDFDW